MNSVSLEAATLKEGVSSTPYFGPVFIDEVHQPANEA